MGQKFDRIVVDATAFWAFTAEVNQMSSKYQIDLGQLSDDVVDTLTNMGIVVKNKTDKDGKNLRGNYITAKSSNPILVVDANKEPMAEKIGNGSTVKAVLQPYAYEFKGKSGVGVGVNVLQVIQHVPAPTPGMDLLD